MAGIDLKLPQQGKEKTLDNRLQTIDFSIRDRTHIEPTSNPPPPFG